MARLKNGRHVRVPDDLMYTVCERFLQEPAPQRQDKTNGKEKKRGKRGHGGKWNAQALADWLTEQGYPTTREGIFPLIRMAIRRGFLRPLTGSP